MAGGLSNESQLVPLLLGGNQCRRFIAEGVLEEGCPPHEDPEAAREREGQKRTRHIFP